MALAECTECHNPISMDADPCSRCGKKDPFRKKANAELLKNTVIFLIMAAAIAYFYFVVFPDIRDHGLFHQLGQH